MPLVLVTERPRTFQYVASTDAGTAVADHVAAGDPHTVYATDSALAAHTHSGVYATPTDVSSAVTTHAGLGDPHPGYMTPAETTAAITAHEALANPHTGYATDQDLIDHVAAADPHTGYLTQSEGDNLYATRTPGFASYLNTAGTSFTIGGAYQAIPYATVVDSHADVTKDGTHKVFTLNRAGVWNIVAGTRILSAPVNQTRYLAILDGSNYTIRYSEQQNYLTTAGGSYTVNRERRFSVGATISIGMLVTGSGSYAMATDTTETNYLSLRWVSP